VFQIRSSWALFLSFLIFVRLDCSISSAFSVGLNLPIPPAGTNYFAIIFKLLQAGHGRIVHGFLLELKLRPEWNASFGFASRNIAVNSNANWESDSSGGL